MTAITQAGTDCINLATKRLTYTLKQTGCAKDVEVLGKNVDTYVNAFKGISERTGAVADSLDGKTLTIMTTDGKVRKGNPLNILPTFVESFTKKAQTKSEKVRPDFRNLNTLA